MRISEVKSNNTFGQKIVVQGSSKQIAKAFALIALSEPVWPKTIHEEWNVWSMVTKNGLLSKLKLIAIGKEDEKALKEYESTLKIPRSGLVTNEEFATFAKDTPVIKAGKLFKAIRQKKFDFVNLKVIE